MPTDPQHLLTFLQAQFSPDATNLTFLKEGWFSQAFGFSAGGQDYILRLNSWEVDFQKDAFAGEYLAGPGLPAPRVVRLGRFDRRLFYAITPRCPGRDLSEWDSETHRRLAPALFTALDALRRWDASALPGWGLTGGDMRGLFGSWPAYLQAIYNQKFSYDLADLAGTFFEPDLYAAVVAAMERDFCFLPAEKWLIHGDYGFDNVVSDGETVTGVLDWAEVRLGDYLYDIANLDYWGAEQGIPFARLWQERIARSNGGSGRGQGPAEPYFTERMRCYTLSMAAHDLRLSAYRNDYPDYLLAKKKAAPFL